MNALQHEMVHTIESCGRTLLDTTNSLLDLNFINKYEKNRSPLRGRQRATQRQLPAGDIQDGEKRGYSRVKLDKVLEEVTECVFAGYSFYHHPQAPPPALTKSSSRVAGNESNQTGIENNQVTIIFDVTDAEWEFYMHAGTWRRILLNVFSNALKYTTSGFIHIGLKSFRKEKEEEQRSASELSGNQASEESEVVLTIKDTGKGIGHEYLQGDLFTPFSQEDSIVSGSGLGLSIVRQAVGFLGGSIEIKSTKNSGTELVIRTMLTHHHGSSPGISSSSDLAFSSLRKHVEGKSMGLLGFGSPLHSKRDTTLYSSLEQLCRNWFGLNVTSVSQLQSNEKRPFDFYLAVQTELDSEDCKGRNLFSWIQHPAGDGEGCRSPVVVICQSPEEAHSMFVAAKNRDESHVFEFISQPCGPRKLARALNLCIEQQLDQQTGHRDSDAEPTHWVEMPESSRLPLHIGPREPPDERMKISKRPTVDTMGSSESVSRQHPPDDGTDTAAAGKISPSPKEELTTGRSVLLVDDNGLNLQLLVAYTKKGDYDYMTGMNGVEAVETYKAQLSRFRIAIIGMFFAPSLFLFFFFSFFFFFASITYTPDISMPLMDGFETARQIRRIEKEYQAQMTESARQASQPMIIAALTGLDSVDAQKEAFGSGIDTFLVKPVKRPELLAILQRMDECVVERK